MKETLAERLKLRKISDLRDHPELVFGFGNEFMQGAVSAAVLALLVQGVFELVERRLSP